MTCHRWLTVAEGVASRHQVRCAFCGLERTRERGAFTTSYFWHGRRVTNKGLVPPCPPSEEHAATEAPQ